MTPELQKKLAGREPLCDAIQLADSLGNVFHFQIEEVMDAGGSCICYRAGKKVAADHFVRGTLKEFYPCNAGEISRCTFDLARVDKTDTEHAQQLRTQPLTGLNFFRERDEFIAVYARILEVQDHVQEIENFIAPFTIFRGISAAEDKLNFTYYIWTEGENTLISFESYLAQMRDEVRTVIGQNRNMNRTLAECFATVLQTVYSFGNALKVLHSLNMLHLDIKPANFGMHTNFGKIIPESVSMFDINSVYSAGNSIRRFAGTKGFCDPDLEACRRDEDINLHCDIYSLGATLYYATVFSEEAGEGNADNLYCTACFDELETRVADSALFRWSELNSQAGVFEGYINILKRCLARGSEQCAQIENYSCVSELLDDMDSLLRLVKAGIDEDFMLPTGKINIPQIIEREMACDTNVDTGAAGAIQCLLYNEPLYEFEKDGIVDVLVLGGGTYAQKFIDTAFELSQVRNCNLSITVISKEKEADQRRFLKLRPDFPRFFTINGTLASEEPYGSIRFLGTDRNGFTLTGDNLARIREAVGELTYKFSYVFIALGDNDLNRHLAAELSTAHDLLAVKKVRRKPLINYVVYTANQPDERTQTADKIICNPVRVENVLVSHEDYGSLYRMALNTHLTWGSDLSDDLKKVRLKFRSPYYFNSSLNNVLSLKYKLHSIGIRWDIRNCVAMSSHVEEKLQQDGENGSFLAELAMYEHRRWIVNCVCNGWRGIPADEYTILKNDNKDKHNRRHACIVAAGAGNALQRPFWRDTANWDREDIEKCEEYNKLDALDKMSVQLHRMYRKKCDSVDVAAIIDDVMELKACLLGDPMLMAAFNSYYACLQSIIHRGEKNILESCRSYKHYLRNLQDLLDKNTAPGSVAAFHLAAVEKAFRPILRAFEYTDFKNNDCTLIRNIPFILNYSTDLRLCIPFEMTAENRFDNISSSLILNPKTVTYLVDLEDVSREGKRLQDSLERIGQIIRNHNLQTRITVVLLCETQKPIPVMRFAETLRQECDFVYNCICICERDARALRKKLRDYLQAVNTSAAAFSAAQRNQTRLSGWVDSLCPSLASYSFDSATMQFRTDSKCSWMAHIPFSAHLSIEDLFCAKDRICYSREPDLLNDYRYFWDNYYKKGKDIAQQRSYATAWKAMCTALGEYADKADRLCEIDYQTNKTAQTLEPFTFYAPVTCKDALKKVFRLLQDPAYRMLSEDSCIEDNSSSAVRLTVRCTAPVKAMLMQLLSDPYRLADAESISTHKERNKLIIKCNDLRVPALKLAHVPGKAANGKETEPHLTQEVIRDFLEKLSADGYLLNYSRTQSREDSSKDIVSFCYCSLPVKELLTNEGKLLEVYVYYELLQSGYFDIVRNGVEVHRVDGPDSAAVNEMDIVAIKGMSAILAEVKARNSVGAEFYTKLYAGAKQFGINTLPVLIADLQNRLKGEHVANAEFIRRGNEEFGIYTVNKPDDIRNIAAVMQKLHKNGDML